LGTLESGKIYNSYIILHREKERRIFSFGKQYSECHTPYIKTVPGKNFFFTKANSECYSPYIVTALGKKKIFLEAILQMLYTIQIYNSRLNIFSIVFLYMKIRKESIEFYFSDVFGFSDKQSICHFPIPPTGMEK